MDAQNQKDLDDALNELKQNTQYAQLYAKIDGMVRFVYNSTRNTYNVGGFNATNNQIHIFLNNKELKQLRKTNPAKYKQLLKEVIVHESIHAYIKLNPANELGLDDDPSPMNNKKTGFGGVLPRINTRYPANGNRIVIQHRLLFRYREEIARYEPIAAVP